MSSTSETLSQSSKIKMGIRIELPSGDTDISHLTPPEPFELKGIHRHFKTGKYYLQVSGRVTTEKAERFRKMKELSGWAFEVVQENNWEQPNPMKMS